MTDTTLGMWQWNPFCIIDRETGRGSSSVVSSEETLSEAKPIKRIKEYMVPCGFVEVTVKGQHPEWSIGLIDKLVQLLCLPEDWYSYGSKRINVEIVKSAIEFLPSIITLRTPAPLVGPTSQGGILMEWHKNGIDLELEFTSPNTIEVLYVENENYEEFEQKVSRPPGRLADIIRRLGE